jgi:hypothetical protein
MVSPKKWYALIVSELEYQGRILLLRQILQQRLVVTANRLVRNWKPKYLAKEGRTSFPCWYERCCGRGGHKCN